MSTAAIPGSPAPPDATPQPADGTPPAPAADPAAPPKAGDPPAPAADPPKGEQPPGGPTPAVVEEKAPDKYELQAPDGMEPDEVASFETMARLQNLSNASAQKVLDNLPAAYAAQADRFLTATKAHAEVGGDKLASAQAAANRAFDHFLPASLPEGAALRRALNVTGYGNFAPLLMWASRVGKAMGEDGGLGARPPAEGPKSAAEVLWPNQT